MKLDHLRDQGLLAVVYDQEIGPAGFFFFRQLLVHPGAYLLLRAAVAQNHSCYSHRLRSRNYNDSIQTAIAAALIEQSGFLDRIGEAFIGLFVLPAGRIGKGSRVNDLFQRS